MSCWQKIKQIQLESRWK